MDRIDRAVDQIHAALKSQSSVTQLLTRDMSSMDELSDNFTGDREITRHMLEKYGQVFIRGERFEL